MNWIRSTGLLVRQVLPLPAFKGEAMTESDRNRNALEGLDAIQRLAEAELKRHYDVDWPGPGPCELTAEETATLHDLLLNRETLLRAIVFACRGAQL